MSDSLGHEKKPWYAAVIPVVFGLGFFGAGAFGAVESWRSGETAGFAACLGFAIFGVLIALGFLLANRRPATWHRRLRDGDVLLRQRRNLAMDLAFPSSFALIFTASLIGVLAKEQGFKDVAFAAGFGVVTLGLDIWFLYVLFGVISPRIRVCVDAVELHRGQKLKINFRVFSVARLRTFRLALEGRELASYTEGTETITDTSVFYRRVLANDAAPGRRFFGSGAAPIPADTMCSLDAPNNKIQWSVHCEADVAWWPDMDTRFELQVDPDDRADPGGVALPGLRPALSPPSDGVMLVLDDEAAVAPGRSVSGTIAWSLSHVPESGTLRLDWTTRGKGDKDRQVVSEEEVSTLRCPTAPPADVAGAPYRQSPVLAEEVPPLRSEDERRFSLLLPEGPYSFSGHDISLLWFLEVSLEPGEEQARRTIVLAPRAKEIRLRKVDDAAG